MLNYQMVIIDNTKKKHHNIHLKGDIALDQEER